MVGTLIAFNSFRVAPMTVMELEMVLQKGLEKALVGAWLGNK